jgi:hypothetical protein
VRDLQGAINGLLAYSIVYNSSIDIRLAELICLSHSKKIIGSFYSTYSRIAAMLSGIELEVVKKDS